MNLHIPGYEIIREARRGGQGVIFQAIQRSTNRKVAIKVLLDGALSDEKALERFQREIEIVAGLRHPYIVAAFDCGETEDRHPFFVMDFVYGQRLNDYIRTKRLDTTAILGLFAEICEGVNYAHQRGVIHRDLKPANIIIDAEGRPRVLDFGLARRVDARGASITTMAGDVIGTLAYMSPEQARGPVGDVDVRTDVYSLGVMLYEMLTGRLPYAVDGELTVALRNIEDATPASLTPRDDNGDSGVRLGRDLETIVRKALSKAPERRYQNAGELGADLRAFLAGEPIEARRDSRMYVARTLLRRHRVWASVVTTFVVLLVAWGVTLSVLYAREQETSRRIQEATTQAIAQRDRAQAAEKTVSERTAMVREMASDLVFEAHDRVVSLAGATTARKLALESALKYLNQLQREAADDPSLGRELAEGLVRLGKVQGGLGMPNVGDSDAAMRSFSKALALCDEGLAADPTDARWRRLSAETHSQMGGLLYSQNRNDEALTNYDKARVFIQGLLAEYPADEDLVASQAHTLQRIGNVYATRWEMAPAREKFEAALRLFEKLLENAPDNPTYQRDAAMVRLRIVRVILGAEKEQGDALPYAERAVAALQALVDAHPDNADDARDLSIALDHRADVLMRIHRLDEAIASIQASRTLCERLATLDPGNLQARHDLMIGCNDLGRALLLADRTDEAMRAYSDGLAHAEALVALDEKNATYRRAVGHCHSNIAKTHAATNDMDKALASMTLAIQVFEGLAAEDEENASVLRDLAIAHDDRGGYRLAIANDGARDRDDRRRAIDAAIQDFEAYQASLTWLRDHGRLADFELKYIDRADDKIRDGGRLRRELADGEP
ncbi:MAG TPA: protein kinase [Phycisphaerae bacterium]|nr:protein kinase [Phycisphaerae bacterium]